MFHVIIVTSDCIQAGLNTFGLRVNQFWWKYFWRFSTWKNWDIALWNLFWSLGCVKNAENVKIVKNQFFEGIVAISPKRYGQFLWFLAQNTFDHKQKNDKKDFSNFFSIFEKTSNLQNLKFLNFVQMLVQILEFSIFPPWWRSWMDTRGSSWGHHKLMCSNTRPNPPRSFDFWVPLLSN